VIASRVALAIAVTLALAACGTSALTTPVLRDRAADACSAATASEAKIAAPSTAAATLTFLQRGIVVLKREHAALHDLDAGGPAAPLFRSAVGALDGELKDVNHAASALKRGADPLSTVRDLQTSLAVLEHQANGAWTRLQIPACLTA
jgi:hypothetical protein